MKIRLGAIWQRVTKKIKASLRNSWDWLLDWRSRKLQREASVKDYIRKLFDPEPVALLADVNRAWELNWMRLGDRLLPSKGANRFDAQKERLGIKDVERTREEGNSSAKDGIDKGFLNYHILCANFHFIRGNFVPYVRVAMFIIAVLMIAKPLAVIFGLTNLISFPDDDTIGLRYMATVEGDYLLRVDNSEPFEGEYHVVYQPPRVRNLNFIAQQGEVLPLVYGQNVYSLLSDSRKQIIFSAPVHSGQTLWVKPDQRIIDAKLRFQIKDSSMITCMDSSLDDSILENTSVLTCPVKSDGVFYIVIELDEELMVGQQSNFGFIAYALDDEKEPNNDQTQAQMLPPGNFLNGSTSISDPDWYKIKADTKQKINIEMYPREIDTFSLLLFEPGNSGYTLAAYSNKSIGFNSQNRLFMLNSVRGRSILLSGFLSAYGIQLSPDWLAKYDLFGIMVIEMVLLVMGSVLVYGYRWLDWLVTPRKYKRSLAVLTFVNILNQLKDDDVLYSIDKRTRLMKTIRSLSIDIPALYKSEQRLPLHATRETKLHFEKIASQINYCNEIIAIPSESTLENLRSLFTKWLDIFMKGEFGDFEFVYEINEPAWHQKFKRVIARNWWKWVGFGFLILLGLILIDTKYPEIANLILEQLVLLSRYVLLVGLVFAVYLKWGPKGNHSNPGFHWNDIVRFILFFVLPFIVLDTLLGTNLLESLVNLLSGLKLFG